MIQHDPNINQQIFRGALHLVSYSFQVAQDRIPSMLMIALRFRQLLDNSSDLFIPCFDVNNKSWKWLTLGSFWQQTNNQQRKNIKIKKQ